MRYSSHLLFLPKYGYLKQYVVEMEEGCVKNIFPLTHEVEDTQWLPGILIVFPTLDINHEFEHTLSFKAIDVLPPLMLESCRGQYLFWASSFDSSKMQFVAGIRHRRLL